MMFYSLLAIAHSTAVEPVCAADDGVCLLQFMKQKQPTFRNAGMEDLMSNGAFDFDSLDKGSGGSKPSAECPGEPVVEYSDPGHCSHQGVQIDFNGKIIEDSFGDNVEMKSFKYYLEDCSSGVCQDIELIDNPTISTHRFLVGTSRVKVEGFDLAGNSEHCYETIHVYDNEPPVFTNGDSDVDGTITVELSEGNCDVEAGEPFAKYETLGWVSSAEDNCDDDVEIVKKIYDSSGTCVYDSRDNTVSMKLPMGVGTYHMTYEAIDGHSENLGLPDGGDITMTTTTHTVTLHLVDTTAPHNTTGCPTEAITVIIEAHEDTGYPTWEPPSVADDNCGVDGSYVVEQSTPQKYPGMPMAVGSHPVRYAFYDQYHNEMHEECIFEVHVIQKAHPVSVTCPADVTFDTVENARSGIVSWDAPVATQGDNTLDASKITYPQGVAPGMMFPFGVTTITVNATGEITGDRVDEHLMYDECTFTVTVQDPFDPKVDGREYRCKNKQSNDVLPYRICDGPVVQVVLHQDYLHAFGYDIPHNSIIQKESLSCCESEDDTLHECNPVPGSNLNKYCTPVV